MNSKHCPHCNFNTDVIKFGTNSSGRQRYRCNICNITWTSKPHLQSLAKHIWDDFVFRNMNYSELANKYRMSERSIRRKMDLYTPPEIIPTHADVIAMDVTYFGRSWGILTVINVHSGKTYTLNLQTAMNRFGITRKPSESCIATGSTLKLQSLMERKE